MTRPWTVIWPVPSFRRWEAGRPPLAGNGVEALASLEKQKADVVLTDMLMPEMDGLQLVQAVRSKYPLTPVHPDDGARSEDIAIQALQKGAASYVPKKSLARDLAETLEQILAASKTKQQEARLLARLDSVESRFVLDNDTSLIPALVGHLEEDLSRLKLCDPGALVLLGVAMHEALTNAILHGNLELLSTLRETDEKEYYRLGVERSRPAAVLQPAGLRHHAVHLAGAVVQHSRRGQRLRPQHLARPDRPQQPRQGISGRGLLLIQTFRTASSTTTRATRSPLIKRVG